ncbi:MAG: GNAT family N-acetyltransferase [Caulobacterales bacterium]|nr:GNAT family N-acetyltransferase [Caulobacterales bacterium]
MDLKVDLIQADDLGASEVELWRQFVQSDSLYETPFFWPEFTQIVSQVVPDARVAVLHRAGTIVGFFPYQMRGRTAQPLAAPMNDYHGLILAPRQQRPLLAAMPGLLRADSLKVNGWVPADFGGPNRRVLRADLRDGWGKYDAERRSAYGKFFKDKDRARRSLARDRAGEVWTEVDVRDPARLDELVAWKRDQYRRTGRHDIFACGWTVDVLRALMMERRPDFGAAMAVLWAGDRPAAMELSLYGGSHYHFWFPSYAADAARCSPGILLSQDTMRLKSADGFKIFDFGFAGECYKKYFCDIEEWVTEKTVLRTGWQRLADRALDEVSIGPAKTLTESLRRRWAVVEACETTSAGRWRGATAAAVTGLEKLRSHAQSGSA